MDLSVTIGSLHLKNPVIAASGCFGYGVEYAGVVDLSSLGGIVVKGLFLEEREGHPAPRVVETPAGMLNAIGLQGIGLSGPAIRPIAVRMVYECRQVVKIPILGMGGIADARDALEFMIAGASAVQVGTANFVDPFIWPKPLDGMRDYLQRHSLARIIDLIGTVDVESKHKEWISS